MLGKTYDTEVCSAARTLELVGERWSLLIIRNALFAGATRFSDFTSLAISTNILANRLDALVAADIMERRDSQYLLTAKGKELAAVIIALTEWGDRWVATEGRPILYTHTCGGEISQQTSCVNCGEIHDFDDVLALPGPGMPADRAARMGHVAG